MNINRIIRDFLFLLFILYYTQGWLYPSGSFLSQIFLLTIILISGIYLFKTLLLINERRNLFYIAWTMLITLNIIGLIFNPVLSEGIVYNSIKNTLGCMLPFYPFYYFSIKGELKSSHLVRFLIVLLPVMIIKFHINEANILMDRSSENMNVVNNLSYSFVRLLPFVFLIRRKRIVSGILMIILVMYIIQGAKRGAIISGIIGLVMYLYYHIKTVEKQNRLIGYLSTVIIIISLSVFTYLFFNNNEFLLRRFSLLVQGDTSNRTLIYSSILDTWYNSETFSNFLFGYGLGGSTLLTGGAEAHNDWLELLSNFGLTGIFIYIFLFYSAVRTYFDCDWNPDKKILWITLILMWFFITLVSMWYTSMGYYSFAILFGYLLGNKNKNIE